MSILEALILGIVQGIAEFLPVSSSGHLQIAKEVLGVQLTDNLSFDVMLHVATVLSTIVVLWGEVKKLFVGVFSFRYNAETAYFLKILVSMIPIGIVGLLFKEQLNAILSSPFILVVVGAMLVLTALLLTFATYAKPRQKENISYRDGFIIGLAQAVAAMPGLSRSGTTIATGILLGNQKAAVAQFSFLMVLLPILGEAFLDVVSGDFVAGLGVGVWPLVAGFTASFVAGCVACKFMIEIVKRSKLVWFALYCAVVGVVSIVFYFL
jgi:undecaprenyl-diphosphatase